MTQFITYQTPDGTTAVIAPAPNCGLTIEQIAAKDVPAGALWQIVDSLPPPPPPPVPATVSRFQARAVLLAENLLHRTESLISQSDDLTKLAWSETVEFHRTSPTIQKIAEYLELTPEQIDELFRKAANIRA